jgi:Mg2+ and Co2+ transporter CorA
MSARDFATGDELADLHRQMEREIEKMELRMEKALEHARRSMGANVVQHPAAETAAIRAELADLRDVVKAQAKIIARMQAAVEELSL